MLQSYSIQNEPYYETNGQAVGLGHYLQILKRRAWYFISAFLVVLLLGAFFVAIQRPLYEAKGKILVESQEIPIELVRPTVRETANQRIQVIQQRILTRDNLLPLVDKYGMFAKQRQWMSGTELLDVMREKTKFELVDANLASGLNTIAFNVSFEYENPEITMKVVNDLLTVILSEDARNRTSRATETTNFLANEARRLQAQLTAIQGQIAEKKIRPQEDPTQTSDPAKMQVIELTKLREELAQKTATYSDEYPAVKSLRKKIAAMQQLIAKSTVRSAAQANDGVEELERQATAFESSLDETNKKLDEARLGEKLERDQRSERLEVIEQPILPQKPIKPNRPKLFAVAFVLAVGVGAGLVFAAESLDRSIRQLNQLAAVANGHLIVSIPYIATRREQLRRKGRWALIAGVVLVLLVVGVGGYLFYGPPIDLSSINTSLLDRLTHFSR
jgi:uncharacterized protein involved in exopolysaccharide biosynthesis